MPSMPHLHLRTLLALSLSALLLPGCKSNAPATAPSGLPEVQMQIGKLTYDLEVASTPDTLEYGLMRRDSMPEDHGMIFVFADERPLTFWMKDTRIPLFILFLDHTGKVVSMAHMKPYETVHTTPSVYPAQYAIELNDDADQNSGVKVGDALKIPTAATQPIGNK